MLEDVDVIVRLGNKEEENVGLLLLAMLEDEDVVVRLGSLDFLDLVGPLNRFAFAICGAIFRGGFDGMMNCGSCVVMSIWAFGFFFASF